MKTKILLNRLAKYYPKRWAKVFHDRVGLMTGKLPEEVHRIVLCLDFDYDVLPFVKKVKPDIIITHHPFIYGNRAFVFKNEPRKAQLTHEIDMLGIPVYSFHTNFDTGKNGMNDALSRTLELENVYAPEKMPMMRIGYLKKAMDVEEFAKYAKEKFKVSYGLLIAEGKKNVKKIGVIGGGGSRYWNIALDERCDIYMSGDTPHHNRRSIVDAKFNYIDFPHEIEHIFMPQMKKILLEIDSSLEVYEIDHEQLPMVI